MRRAANVPLRRKTVKHKRLYAALVAMAALLAGCAAKTTTTTAKKHKRRHVEPPPQNFQVCVNNAGYYICNQPPGPANTTHPAIVIKEEKPYDPVADARYSHDEVVTPITEPVPVGPVSQSYPDNIYTVIGVPHPYQNPRYIKLGPYGYKRP